MPVYCGRRNRLGSSAHNCGVDRIVLEGMSFQGRHGVRLAEREQPQEFKVDVEGDSDLSAAGNSDRIEDTVDYRQVPASAKEGIQGETQKLLRPPASRHVARW